MKVFLKIFSARVNSTMNKVTWLLITHNSFYLKDNPPAGPFLDEQSFSSTPPPASQFIQIAATIANSIEDTNDDEAFLETLASETWDFEELREELSLAIEIEQSSDSVDVYSGNWDLYLQDHKSRPLYEKVVKRFNDFAAPLRQQNLV